VDEQLPELRIGDRERKQVDARLQQAMADGVLTLTEYDERAEQCWAARTQRDLDAITRDLPAPQPAPQAAVAAAPAPAPVHAGRHGAGRTRGGVVAAVVVGVGILLGVQVLSADDGVSVFGSRTVQVAPGQDNVEVGMLFGSVEIVVPDDARVQTSGTVLFGSVNCDEACNGTGTRAVIVDATGGFGSVGIVRQSEAAARSNGQDRDGQDHDD
jgi:hypothetical protein